MYYSSAENKDEDEDVLGNGNFKSALPHKSCFEHNFLITAHIDVYVSVICLVVVASDGMTIVCWISKFGNLKHQ